MSKKIEDEETRLILAIHQLDGIVKLTEDNEYRQFIHSRMISVKYELLRQLTNLNDRNKNQRNTNTEWICFGGTVEKDIPEDVVWIDDVFYIKETRFGLYTSILKEPLGQHFITGATREGVLTVTRWHLKALQEGTLGEYTRVINSGVVGGKL